MKIAMVTGASSGIGEEFVRRLDRKCSEADEIWMIARNTKKMEQVSLSLKHKTRIIGLDLEKDEQRRQLQCLLKEKAPEIYMLVNCAGFGLMGDFQELDIEEQLNMVELNCKALTAVTYMAIPYMAKNSRILQISSAAAFVPQAGFAVYAATKSYVLSFSRALQRELLSREIYVTAVCPGPVKTPFFDRAETKGKTLALKKYFSVSAKKVVKNAIYASKRKKAVTVCSLPMKLFMLLCKVVPHSLILSIAGNCKKDS